MRGGQWQALRLLEGERDAGVEIILLTPGGSPLGERARALGLRVLPFGAISFARHARHADLVHAHDARSHTLAACLPGPPLLVSRRVGFPIRTRWKYARARRYLAVSHYVKSVLVRGGVPEHKVSVVYDGVPLLPIEPPGDCAIAPASDDPQKGSQLSACAAQRAGIKLRFSQNLAQDLPGSGLCVYITHSEGLGSGALLAMAAGVPVVASNVGGLPEVIVHGENGLLAENSVEAIAAAIRRVCGDPALARRLGAAGRRTVEERFSVARMVEATLSEYRQVLAC